MRKKRLIHLNFTMDTEDVRNKGVIALKSFLKVEKNIITLDKAIWLYACHMNTVDPIEFRYLDILFQVLLDVKKGEKVTYVMEKIKKRKYGFGSSVFDKIQLNELEQDNFIKNPFEIEEGVLECKCGSKRVFSYQKQVRSLDEPMSTFATCSNCGNEWVYSG